MNKRILNLNVFIFILIIISSNISLSSVQDNDLEKDAAISKLISETISTSTSSQNLFSDNLIKLKALNDEGVLSSSQLCLYDFLQGYKMGFMGHYESAIKKLKATFDSCAEISTKVRTIATLANLQVISKQYEQAINSLNFAILNLDKISDIELRHKVYIVATVVYRLVNQNDLSLKFSNLLIDDNPDGEYRCKALAAKQRARLKLNPLNLTESEVKNTIKICNANDQYIISGFLELEWIEVKLSDKYQSKEQISNMLNRLKRVDETIEGTQYQNLISVKNSLFAKIYLKLEDFEKARIYANLAIDGSKGIGTTKQKIESLDVLMKYYKVQDDLEKTLFYSNEKSIAEKVNFNDDQAKNMAYQTVMHSNYANKQEIKLLNQQNIVLALENNLSEKSAQVQKLVILLLIVVTGIFVLWGLWQRRSQRIYKELSERDHMTSIFNRNGLKQYSESLIAYSRENNKQVGCAVFDLDFFKRINDEFGHATGDWAIKNVIKKCQSLGNSKASFGRLGGEEFAIILSDASKEELYVLCESCRNAINSLVTKESGHNFKISASFGMTTSDVSGLSYSNLLIHADEALYKAKKSGRNNTVIYQTEYYEPIIHPLTPDT